MVVSDNGEDAGVLPVTFFMHAISLHFCHLNLCILPPHSSVSEFIGALFLFAGRCMMFSPFQLEKDRLGQGYRAKRHGNLQRVHCGCDHKL